MIDPVPSFYSHVRRVDSSDPLPSSIPELDKLLKALEAGGYNAAPSKLVQGSLHFEDISPIINCMMNPIVCECGAEKCKSNIHSNWCPKCVK